MMKSNSLSATRICPRILLKAASHFAAQVILHGFLKNQSSGFSYTDCTDRTELFRLLTEKTVMSVSSVYQESVLSSFLEKAIVSCKSRRAAH